MKVAVGLAISIPLLLNVMVYPHPDGVRPGNLAERINMTKQVDELLARSVGSPRLHRTQGSKGERAASSISYPPRLAVDRPATGGRA
jgi:hypothetical protein